MAKTVTLWFEHDSQADTLVEDMREYPGSAILTPCQEHDVYAAIVEPITTGMWCRNCEFLEQPYEVTRTREGCGSCRCNFESHISVKVVSNGNSSGTT